MTCVYIVSDSLAYIYAVHARITTSVITMSGVYRPNLPYHIGRGVENAHLVLLRQRFSSDRRAQVGIVFGNKNMLRATLGLGSVRGAGSATGAVSASAGRNGEGFPLWFPLLRLFILRCRQAGGPAGAQ